MELLEDGTLRIWSFTESLDVHSTSGWDLQLTLTPEEHRELLNLLVAVDLSGLPHTTPWAECATTLYFKGPGDMDPVQLSYGPASALEPEFDAVYAWLGAYFDAHASDYDPPGEYCEF